MQATLIEFVLTFTTMIIIGITGTLGAGKGTIVEYLTEHYGFRHFSVRALVTEHIRKAGLEVNRDNMVKIANDLRQEHGPSVLVEILYERAMDSGDNCIIESIRTPGEVAALRSKGRFFLIAVDADPSVRFERIKKRDSETDKISFETFIQNEAREMTSTDPNHQNLHTCIEQADFLFNNNGSREELFKNLDAIFAPIIKAEQHDG